MHLFYLLAAITGGLFVIVVGLYALGRWLQRREPYGSFLRLRLRQKVTFFRRLVADPRVPRFVKVVPFALLVYLAIPIDLIPDFIPVLGYVDDVAIVIAALAVVMKFTPRLVIEDILGSLQQQGHDSNNGR